MSTSVFRPVLGFASTLLMLTTLLRVLLVLVTSSMSVRELSHIVFWGLRVDLQCIGVLCFLLVIFTTIFAHSRTQKNWALSIRALIAVLIPAALIFELWMPGGVANYGLRPDSLASAQDAQMTSIDPIVIAQNWLFFGLGLAVMIMLIVVAWKLTKAWVAENQWQDYDWILSVVLLVLCFAAARGTGTPFS